MSDAWTVRQRLLVVGVAAASAFAAFVVMAGPAPTDAAWTVTRTLDVNATAVTPTPPTGLVCSPTNGLGGNITFSWTAPAGTAPSEYTLKWTGGGGGQTTSLTTSVMVAAPILALGSVYTIYSDYGSWQSVAGSQTRTVTSVAGAWSCGP